MTKLLTYILCLACFFATAQDKNQYLVQVDLTSVKDDQLPVSIFPPEIEAEFVEYHMARIVPGTYDESNFGSFVKEFKAIDKEGRELKVERLDTNRWKIENASSLHKITYRVHDTFDRFGNYGNDMEDFIFEPGGTNFDKYKNIYVLNTFGLTGYISGMEDIPYELEIKHEPSIYGASALKKSNLGDTLDIFRAENFNFLADGPIMYSPPDTISRKIANAEVMVSCYSPNNLVTAKEIMDKIYDLMIAQAAYLGGKLPVERYSYLVFTVNDKITPYFGALEHS